MRIFSRHIIIQLLLTGLVVVTLNLYVFGSWSGWLRPEQEASVPHQSDEEWIRAAAALTDNDYVHSTDVKRILILSYMRGGGSFTGELLNTNPNIFYHYEPLDGVYSWLYGTKSGWKPADIYYDIQDHPRSIKPYEREPLEAAVKNILQCDFDHLPAEVVHHPFISTYISRNVGFFQFKPYELCTAKVTKNSQLSLPPNSDACKRYLLLYCHPAFRGGHPCFSLLHTYRDNKAYFRLRGARKVADSVLAALENHQRCLNHSKKVSRQCLPQLTNLCRSKKIRAAKLIRYNMDIIGSLLKSIPGLKIVHVVRDPRGIVISRNRTKLLSIVSRGSVEKEAKLLCNRMMADVKRLEQLKEEYPDQIISFRYESFAVRPLAKATLLYNDLGLGKIPSQIEMFLSKNTQSNKINAENAFGVERKDSSLTAFQWKNSSQTIIKQITNQCIELLRYLDYQI